MRMSFIHKKSCMINEVRRLNCSCVHLERDGYMLYVIINILIDNKNKDSTDSISNSQV